MNDSPGSDPVPVRREGEAPSRLVDEPGFVAARIRFAATAFLLSLFLSIVYAASRVGFSPLPFGPLAEALSLAAILLLLPTALPLALARRRAIFRIPWWANAATFTFAGFLLVLVVSFLPPPVPRVLLVFGGSVSVLLALGELRRAPSEARRRPRVPSLLALSALFAWIAFVVWGTGQATPLWLENVVTGGVHVDVLFHAALANMLRTHGIPSTGLEGLLPISYHWGTHFLFGRLSEMLGRPAIEIAALIHPVALIPCLLSAIGGFVLELRRRLGVPHRTGALFWPLLAAAFLGVLPATALREMALDWNLHLVSESYLLGLVGFFLLGSLLLAAPRGGEGRTPSLRVFDLGLFPLLFAILALVKVSVGILALVLALFLAFRTRLLRDRGLLLGLAAGALLTALVTLRGSPGAGESPIAPFAFFREWVRPGWWPLFPVLYFGWGWLLALLRLRQVGARTLQEAVAALRARRLLDVEAVLALALVGSLPGLFLSAPAGAAHYFSDLHRWLALAFVLALVEPELSRGLEARVGEARAGWRSFGIAPIAGAILAAALATTAFGNLLLVGRSFAAQNLEIRERIARERDPSFDFRRRLKAALASGELRKIGSLAARIGGGSIGAELRECRDHEAIRLLLELGAEPTSKRRDEILYAPPEADPYWRLARRSVFTHLFWSRSTPFVAPALAARPLLGAIPSILPARIDRSDVDLALLDERDVDLLRTVYSPSGENAWQLDPDAGEARLAVAAAALAPHHGQVHRFYGYSADAAPRLPPPTGDAGTEAAAKAARQQGFRRLIQLEADGNRLRIRTIDLGAGSPGPGR